MLEDEFLPAYDVSDAVATVVRADAAAAWEALMAVDLIELGRRRPLVGLLGAVRMLPEVVAHLLHGELPAAPPERMRLRDTAAIHAGAGGWVLLEERPGAIALGLIGRFWRPVIEYAEVSAADFRDFSEPGWAKTVYALSARPLGEGEGTLLSAVMRTATTDEHARRWFRRYWTLGVGPGAHVLVSGLLEAARDDAEGAAHDPAG